MGTILQRVVVTWAGQGRITSATTLSIREVTGLWPKGRCKVTEGCGKSRHRFLILPFLSRLRPTDGARASSSQERTSSLISGCTEQVGCESTRAKEQDWTWGHP